MAILERFYAINKSSNSVFYSDDYGDTWSEIPSNVSTTSASDIAVNPAIYNNILVLNGATSATTPYLSIDGAVTFNPGANIAGKEILYVSSTGIIVGGKRLKSDTGPEIFISNDSGVSFTQSIDTSSLFDYPGANYSNITVTGVDFTADCGGYIAVAGNENNTNADQILTRTYDYGVTFPDSIILDGNTYGVIRCVYSDPSGKVVFAAGNPGVNGAGKIYLINNFLTDIPIEVLGNVTVGDTTNTTITKFFTSEKTRGVIFFIDATGKLYQSGDGGSNWTLLSTIPGDCVDIIAINEGSTILALTASPNAIQKSINGGVSWTEISQPTWNNPEALAYTSGENACLTCPDGYLTVEYAIPGLGFDRRCDRKLLAGPICKPPYVYFAVENACASKATLGNVNIIYSIDYSSSLEGQELASYKSFLEELTDQISDRLELGTVKVGIVKWASAPCNVLDFTSDVTTIKNTILSDNIPCNIGGGTNHVAAFCTAVRMFDAETQINPAKNILIVLTDGTHSGRAGCNLTDLGFEPNIPLQNANGSVVFENGSFLQLSKDVRENLAPEGLQIMVVVAGSQGDRTAMNNQFIIDPLASNFEPYPSKARSGNYYYFDAGNFDNFPEIVQQVRLGLAADLYPIPPCPEGCVGIAGPDGEGYCECLDSFSVERCIYKLTDCTGITGPFYCSDPMLEENVNNLNGRLSFAQFLTNAGGDDTFGEPGCFSITKLTDQEVNDLPPGTDIKLNAFTSVEFADCPSCVGITITKFTNCADSNDVVYTEQNLDNFGYDPTKPVLKNTNPTYIDKCWSVILDSQDITPSPLDNTFLLAIDSQYAECIECLPIDNPSYKLTDTCENIELPVYTENDFSNYTGKIVKVLQYPNVCWNVSINFDQDFSVENLTVDGLAFDSCQECLPVSIATYTLTSCDPPFTNQIATDSNLGQYVDGTVRLTTTGDTCWNVTSESLPNLVLQPVSVSQSFASCQDCYPQIYSFTDCQNPDNKIYTLIDFSAYLGQYLRLQEYPGVCWICGVTDDITLPRQDVTISGDPYGSCPECVVSYYQLTNCANEDVYLISASDLSRYVNRVITAAGYPSLCFTVTEPRCECIKLTVNDIDYNVSAQPNLFNNRYSYTFTSESGDSLSLAWSINPNRWELFNSNTLEIYSFSTADTECPFSNFWTIQQGSSYIVNRVTFCPDDIYAISPELDFADCLPCIKCI
jgi:hypothetical protein